VWSSCKNILFDLSGTKFVSLWIVSNSSSCELYQVYSYLSPDYIRVKMVCMLWSLVPVYLMFQPYYLIECRHVAVLSSIIQSMGAGAFWSTSIVWLKTPREVWLGLTTTKSSWQHRKTWHEGFDSSNYGKFSLLWVM
jgi:hypothetical protein